MRKELFRTVMVAQALAVLAAAAPAVAQTAPVMAMGRAATPPAGYLDFCARRPEQCGLEGATDASGQPLGGETLARALYAQYYWPVALGGPAKRAVLVPSAGGARYDQVTQTKAGQGSAAPAWDDTPAYAVRPAVLPRMAAAAVTVDPPTRPEKIAEFNGFKAVEPAPRAASASFSLPSQAIEADLAEAFAIRPITQDSDHYALASLVFTFEDRPGQDTVSQPYRYDLIRALRLSWSTPAAPARIYDREAKAEPKPKAAPLLAPRPQPVAGYDAPAYAVAQRSGPRPLVADRALMAELDHVNQGVNHAIRYVLDKNLYGREDYWHMSLEPGGPRAGDCKDYVLEKRRALIQDGVPAENLSIAIVRTGWNEPHAVLLVTTDQGEMVLDSLSSWVQPWWKVRYKWVERQAPGRQLDWVSLL